MSTTGCLQWSCEELCRLIELGSRETMTLRLLTSVPTGGSNLNRPCQGRVPKHVAIPVY